MTPARGLVTDTDPSAEDIARLIQQIRTKGEGDRSSRT